MQAVRVLLVSHDDQLRAELIAHIASGDGVELVAEAASGHQAISAAVEHTPDLAIVDDELPGLSGQCVSAVLLRHVPGIQVISIVPVLDFDHLNETVRHGGATALARQVTAGEVVAAIRAVTMDAFRFHPWPAQRLAAEFADGFRQEEDAIQLTLNSLQAAVLDCLLVGLNASEITKELGITNYALRREMTGLFDALHVDKKVGAIAAALERRWSNVGRRSLSVTSAASDAETPGPPARLDRMDDVAVRPELYEYAG